MIGVFWINIFFIHMLVRIKKLSKQEFKTNSASVLLNVFWNTVMQTEIYLQILSWVSFLRNLTQFKIDTLMLWNSEAATRGALWKKGFLEILQN